jgi:hypothetical protein
MRINEESIFTSQIKLWYLSDGVDVYYKYYECKAVFSVVRFSPMFQCKIIPMRMSVTYLCMY